MEYLVFVYGSLKRGYWNYETFLKGRSKFVCDAETCYKMYMTDIGYPLVTKTIPKTTIKGELFIIDEIVLKDLDTLEGHPVYYHREITEVIANDGKVLKAWMYFNDRVEGKCISNGIWS